MDEEVITLREYVDLRAAGLAKEFQDYKDNTQEARRLAGINIDSKLEKLNELRQEVTQDRGLYVTRAEQKAEQEAINRRLSALESWQSKLMGIGIVLAVVAGLIGAAIARLFNR
jgi:hypothetical protein